MLNLKLIKEMVTKYFKYNKATGVVKAGTDKLTFWANIPKYWSEHDVINFISTKNPETKNYLQIVSDETKGKI